MSSKHDFCPTLPEVMKKQFPGTHMHRYAPNKTIYTENQLSVYHVPVWCAYMCQWSNHHWFIKCLSPRRQAIIWTNAGILLIRPFETNFSGILIKIHTFSFKKIHLKMSSGKWRPFCLGLNVLNRIEYGIPFKWIKHSLFALSPSGESFVCMSHLIINGMVK